MKFLKTEQDSILAMSKLSETYADKDITGEIGKFIYFSEVNSGHGPRIKFYGGASQTDSTKTSPSLGFSKNGSDMAPTLQPWMNRKNCPNAFDQEYIDMIRAFVNKQLPILLLVWYRRLGEDDALMYFNGMLEWDSLLDKIKVSDGSTRIQNCKNTDELRRFCEAHDLYRF